ncbi:DUF3515 family protein [Streptomyces sp. NPDC002446]
MVRLSGRSRVVAGVAVAGAVVAGAVVVREMNSPAFGVEAAPSGGGPECTRIANGYPDRLNGQERDRVDLPGVAVWGSGAVVLRCGLTPPRPTTDTCVSVDEVDWVLREARSRDGRKLLITYGRHPAVEAAISDQAPELDALLVELSRIVKPLRQHEHCI